MGKTIKEWFKWLPKEIGDKAMNNLLNQITDIKDFGDVVEVSLLQSIAGGIDWDTSLEGREYWQNIYDNIALGESDFIFDMPEILAIVEYKSMKINCLDKTTIYMDTKKEIENVIERSWENTDFEIEVLLKTNDNKDEVGIISILYNIEGAPKYKIKFKKQKE